MLGRLVGNRRLFAALVAIVVIVVVSAAIMVWQNNNPSGGTVVNIAPKQCRQDPAHVPPPPSSAANYLHTCGNQIYDAHGQPVRITGVSWFGLETANMAPDGLWARNWQTILDQLKALGFNTIRLPFSDDILRPGAQPSGINYLLNPDLKGLSSLEVMDRVIAGARQRGLRVLLDRHRPSSAGQSDLWYTTQRSQADWINEWRFLAQRYRGDDTVIGADLDNEPRGAATWGSNDSRTDWRLAAEQAGNAVLSVNPYWLVFVEGIERSGNDWYWWGGNLSGAGNAPVILNVPNRVVYSPHDYGPDVYPQGWFKSPGFPANLPSVWDAHWGYIAEQGIAPVVLGEFGGRSVGSDAEGQWHRALVAYLDKHQIGFISWALNPDSGDTGGILEDDWLTVNAGKENLLRSSLAPPIIPSQSNTAAAPGSLQVSYHLVSAPAPTTSVSFEVTLFNHSGQPVKLFGTTLRYWLNGNDLNMAVAVDWADIGDSQVTARVVSSRQGNQNGYLEIGFHDATLPAYGTSGPILLRYHRTDWGTFDPSRDFSFGRTTSDQPWPRIGLYQNSHLVSGNLP